MRTDQIRTGKRIQRRTGATFHLATRLLPERIRHPTYVLYGFFRIADEVVDDPGESTPAERIARLDVLREKALGREPSDDPVLSAFRTLVDEHDIPEREVDVFVDAMQSDVHKARYATEDELETYMRGSAAAVGVMMTAVMDPDDYETAIPHARALGEAFQRTNFLRDVREDVEELDRIYLPQETLGTHGVTDEQIVRLEADESFAAVMREELERAETRYEHGVAGIRYLPADCQFAVLLATVLYADYHRQIRARNFDVLSSPPSLSTARKLTLLARTRWHWAWNRDPEAVFRRVTDLPDFEPRVVGEGRPSPVR